MTTKRVKTPKQISKSGKPFQTTIIIRSQRGLNLLAWCRENSFDVSGVIDALLATASPALLESKGRTATLSVEFAWPTQKGVRP